MEQPEKVLADLCVGACARITDAERDELSRRILSADRIFVLGIGRSGLIAQLFAVRLVQMGLRVYFIGDMTTPLIAPDDLVILVSNSGDTMSVVKTAEIAHNIGTPTVCITGTPGSDLTAFQDQAIIIDMTEKGDPAAPLGTVFEDAALLFLDGMIPFIMRKTGATEQEMRRRHAIWV